MNSINILLVEDNPGDALLTREAFEESTFEVRLNHVTDGVQALHYLRGEPPYEQRSLPDLVLLDLNMPRKGGLEVLSEVKADPLLRNLPMVVLTTSEAEADILRSYHNYANAYIVKPVDLGSFLEVVTSLENFWMRVARLPSSGSEL